MTNISDGRLDLVFGALENWPVLRVTQAKQLNLENADFNLEANRSIIFSGNGQISTVGDLSFLTGATSPTEQLRIFANGNIGIGTGATVPTNKLEVAGKIKANDLEVTGTITANTMTGPLAIQNNLTVSGNLKLGDLTVNKFSSDGTLNGNSDQAIPTEKAIKTYVDNIAVTTQKIANDAVTTPKIKDSAVTAAKIADNSVTTAKIQNGAITQEKLDPSISFEPADGAVTTASIQNGAITQEKLAASFKLPDGSVGTAQLANSAITTDKIADKSITAAKLNFTLPSGSNQWQGVDGGSISYSNGNVGLGTNTPQAKLQVANGAIMPSAGNSENAGIMFPKDAFTGSGDAAWIRYYARTGEATTLEIGTSNDADDHIALMPSLGNVGIRTINPQANLHVFSALNQATLRIQAAPTNKFGSGRIEFWSDTQGSSSEWRPGFIQSTDQGGFTGGLAFFVNGTGLANKTAEIEVMRITNGNVGIGTQSPEALLHVFSPDPTFGGNVKLFPTDGKRSDFSYDGGNDGIFAFTNYGKDTGDTRFQWQKPDNSFVRLLQIKNNGQVIGNFVQSSSRELKENITDFSTQEAIEALANLNPVKFNYREDNQKQLKAGFIAEDVPELVATADRKAICALDIVAVLTKVIKQQQEELSCLKERLNALEAAAS